MPNYKLLTPGPLTITDTVKKEMLFDHCTWDDDYKQITLSIREKLLKLAHVSEPEYTVVLMQGSGTFGVESVLASVIGENDKPFAQALKEMEEEGGIPARAKRYEENNHLLIQRMAEMGIHPYIGSEHQGPIITTFLYPEHHNFSFQEMYQYIKDRGYAIYPGKVTDADTFRIGNIGEIYKEDIEKLCSIIKEFLEEK